MKKRYEDLLAFLKSTGKDVYEREIKSGLQPDFIEAWHKGKVISRETGKEYDAWLCFNIGLPDIRHWALVKIGKNWFAEGANYYTIKKFKEHGLQDYDYKLNVPIRTEEK